MTEKINGPDGFADEAKAVEDFLQFLPVRLQQYSRDCVVFNATTGRYEDAVSTNDTTNSGTTSPLEGRRAPPPTPATVAAALENSTGGLEPVPEDDTLALIVPSRVASPDPWSAAVEAAEVTPSSTAETSASADSTVVPTATAASESSAVQEWNIVAEGKLTDTTEPALSLRPDDAKADEAFATSTAEIRKISPATATINAFTFLSAKNGNKGPEASKVAKPGFFCRTSNSSRPRLSPLATRDPNINNSTSDASFQDKVVEAFRAEYEDDEMKKSVRFALDKMDGSPPVEVPTTVSPKSGDGGSATSTKPTAATTSTATVPAATKVESATDTGTAADGDDPQDATYFANWVAPETRTGPKAEVRRVVIKDLPAAIDNTHIGGLIRGGLLESYRLVKNPASAVATAVIIFASGTLAKAFYDKHRNGLEVKFSGKKTVAIVKMGDSVDLVSGVMRGYLESGATRVVRAEGADEDWAMRALRKIAEEKNRKLEAIFDTSNDEGRTVEFRFTNIADAVAFRGSLIRDADWADCNIQFGEDPCACKT